MARARTWVKRVALGLGALIVIVVAGVLITMHTDYGREIIRKQAEARLNDTFAGGASIGAIEGSVLGDLTLRNIVLNGPDKKPAVKIGKLKLKLGILPIIMSKQVRVGGVIAEDVDVDLRRDPDGTLQVTRMLKPKDKDSGMSFDIPQIEIRRGHISFDTGSKQGVINLDALTIFGALHMPHNKPLDANVSLRGAWRERATGFGLDAVINSHEGVTSIPSLTALLGGVTVAGSAIRIIGGTPDSPPVIDGLVVLNAPVAAVKQILPDVELPADVSVAITAYQMMPPWTQLSVLGNVGTTPVRAMLSADFSKKRAMGVVASGDLDLATLTKGRIDGNGGAVVIFDGALGRAGELPVASGVITAWGKVLDVPHGRIAVAFNTDGERASTVVGLKGDSVTAMLAANVKKIGEAITLERSTLIASTSNPAKLSGGKAPMNGYLDVNLTASGALTPALNLAVAGRAKGKRLRMQGISVASADLAIKATNLPNQPRGKLELRAKDVIRDTVHLKVLEVDAASRADNRIAVAVRTQPKQNPWLVDVDALVTPPGRGDVILVDLVRHHIRAGNGVNWHGATGHIEIGPQQVLVRDFATAGTKGGTIAINGVLDRAGRNSGDLAAKIDVVSLALDNMQTGYRGTVDAHVDVTRKNNQFAGTVSVAAKGLARDLSPFALDADLQVVAQAGNLRIDAKATHPTAGAASVVLDVHAPKDVANADTWKRLHRNAIREARIKLEKIDLVQIAEALGMKGELAGSVNGELSINQTMAGGTIQIRDVMAPALRGTGGLNADLQISQTAPDELSPVLTGKVGGIGDFTVAARLGSPEHLFDPAAWKSLGAGAVRGLTAKVDHVKIEPGLLDRFGLVTDLRGDASFTAEMSEAMRSAQFNLALTNLRGTPIAEPVTAHFTVAVDDKSANTSLAVRAPKAMLLEMRGTVPITLTELRANPKSVLALPLDMTATIPNAPAPAMLNVFGRSEIIAGTINGTIKIAGTVEKPTLKANLAGVGLQVPPGPRNRPIKKIEKITIDATWDGTTGNVEIHGTQQKGSLDIVASGSPSALDQGTLTIKAKEFDLVPLLVFAPGPAGGAAGRLDADLTVKGLDPVKARVIGDLHLSNARIPVNPNLGTLRRAKVDIVMGENDMKISLTGRMGNGSVDLKSTIALNGAEPTSGVATIKLRKISPIGEIEPDVDADIDVKLTKDSSKWIADVDVRKGVVKVPKDRGEKLKPIGAPKDMVFMTDKQKTKQEIAEAGKPPTRPSLVANITLHSTYVESAEIRGIIKGKVTVSVDADQVGIVGRLDADRGDLDLFGRRYQVERAAVRFDGSTDPLLDVMISHDFPDVTTVTQVRGRLSKPELFMSSNPGIYSQGQLLGFLLGGEPAGGDPKQGGARDAVTGAGTSIIANKIGGYVRDALPVDIDVLRYEAASASSSAAVTVGSWLTRSLFVSYRVHISARPDENASEAEAEYWLSRRVVVEAVVGDRSVNGIDLLWRKRY